MKLISWNCNMAYRGKAAALLQYQPDIVVVPECEQPEKLKFPEGVTQPIDQIWFGNNPHKGIGIFSYSKYRFSLFKHYNPAFRYVIPVSVTGGKQEFNLFAIWANNPDDKDGRYVEQIWKALQYYEKLLTGSPVLLAGDFNSNTIWDISHKWGGHSAVVDYLAERGVPSTYHKFHKMKQGEEAHATLYMHRNQQKPYHIDYCFASKGFMRKLTAVEIGKYEDWAGLSDHVPLMITF